MPPCTATPCPTARWRWLSHTLQSDAEITVRIVVPRRPGAERRLPAGLPTCFLSTTRRSPWSTDLVLCAQCVKPRNKVRRCRALRPPAGARRLHAQGWDRRRGRPDRRLREGDRSPAGFETLLIPTHPTFPQALNYAFVFFWRRDSTCVWRWRFQVPAGGSHRL
jgi:hypothetical protein